VDRVRGEIGDGEAGFLSNAVLCFRSFGRAFGLVMIEAMACGTPVVAWRCGAVPEIVDHGVTGFIVTSEDEAVSAVERASSLDRSEIRRTFERRFTSKVMARNYLALYWSLAHDGDPHLKVAAVG
jgi:glycosyltransferase involved in cell wall biosynthesis